MVVGQFDTSVRDAAGSEIAPIAPELFDLNAYAEYEAELLERNRRFVESESGLLVYRRFRANGVFYDKCRDYKESLALQLGALQTSMGYKADIANFLEPWYGIAYIAASFGGKYKWTPEQSPSADALFHSAQELLDSDYVPIAQTPEGKHTLEMIEYFLDKTKGKIPMSFSDLQSPINMLSYLMPITDMFMEVYEDPDGLKQAAHLVADLLIEFMKEQEKLIGDALARPGHGFASSRAFKGAGLSDDNAIMISQEDYEELFLEADEKIGDQFGGMVFHSCGNWEKKIDMVKGYRNIRCADGAFSIETDPSPNTPEIFGEAFAGSGIVLNTRVIGTVESSFQAFKKLWRPNQKLICVTNVKTAGEQAELYEKLHRMAGQL